MAQMISEVFSFKMCHDHDLTSFGEFLKQYNTYLNSRQGVLMVSALDSGRIKQFGFEQ